MPRKDELQAQNIELSNRLCNANIEIARLREQLKQADIRTKKVIAQSKGRELPLGIPGRREAMAAAKAEAMRTGATSIKAEF